MSDPCPHDLAERETACADGMCPLCMAAEIDRLRAVIQRYEDERIARLGGIGSPA